MLPDERIDPKRRRELNDFIALHNAHVRRERMAAIKAGLFFALALLGLLATYFMGVN